MTSNSKWYLKLGLTKHLRKKTVIFSRSDKRNKTLSLWSNKLWKGKYMGKLVEDKSQLVKFMLIRFCVISSDKAIMPFLVWEVGMKQTPSQEEFMFYFKADGGGKRVHPGWLFLDLELKIILCQSGIFWVYIL